MKFILSLVLYCVSALAMKKLAVEQRDFETVFMPQHLVMFHVKETPNAVYSFKEQVYVRDLVTGTQREIELKWDISRINHISIVDGCIHVNCKVYEDYKCYIYTALIPISPKFQLFSWRRYNGTLPSLDFVHRGENYWVERSDKILGTLNVIRDHKGIIGSVDPVDGYTVDVALVSHEKNKLFVVSCTEKVKGSGTLIDGFKFDLDQDNPDRQQKRMFAIDITDRIYSIKPFHLNGNIIVNYVKFIRDNDYIYRFMVHEYCEDGGIPVLIAYAELTCNPGRIRMISAVSDGMYVFVLTNNMKLICSGSDEPRALNGLHALRITATGEIWCVQIDCKVGLFETKTDLKLNRYPLVCKGGDLVLGWPNIRAVDTITIKGVEDESKWTLVSKPNVTARCELPSYRQDPFSEWLVV